MTKAATGTAKRKVATPGKARTGAPASSKFDTLWAKRRVKAGVSKGTLAAAAQLSLSAVNAIESGKREATKDEARALRSALAL